MKVRYSHNNSGGSWWLKDKDWKNLAAEGWVVEWYSDRGSIFGEGDRFLGALASEASKDFPSLREGIVEWERITDQNADDEGCPCCGQPHYFYVVDKDESGV